MKCCVQVEDASHSCRKMDKARSCAGCQVHKKMSSTGWRHDIGLCEQSRDITESCGFEKRKSVLFDFKTTLLFLTILTLQHFAFDTNRRLL